MLCGIWRKKNSKTMVIALVRDYEKDIIAEDKILDKKFLEWEKKAEEEAKIKRKYFRKAPSKKQVVEEMKTFNPDLYEKEKRDYDDYLKYRRRMRFKGTDVEFEEYDNNRFKRRKLSMSKWYKKNKERIRRIRFVKRYIGDCIIYRGIDDGILNHIYNNLMKGIGGVVVGCKSDEPLI